MNVEYLDLINKLYKINNTNSEVYIKYLANLTENYIKKNAIIFHFIICMFSKLHN